MKLRALRVRNVGPFGEEGCALDGLSDGLNVVRESNEAGKTTLYRALKLVLFDAHNSKKQHIKDLRCDRSTDGLYVELDLEIDGQTYRLVKQYLKGDKAAVIDLNSNRVIAESKDAEAWIAERLGSDKLETSSPGLLWIGQGDSLIQPTSQDGAGRKLFESLEGEIETVVGGDQASAVLQQARARLLEYLTVSGNPRAQLKDAMDEVERLREEALELGDQVRDSEAARGDLVELEKKLEGLSEENESEHSKALEVARKALYDAHQVEEKVKGLRSGMEAADACAAMTNAELATFRGRLRELMDLKDRWAKKNDEAATARQRADASEEDLKLDREQAAGLKQSYEDAKSAFAEAEATSRKIEAISKRQSTKSALAKARDITRNLTSAQKDAALELPDLEEINRAHEDLIKCRSAADATRPSLRVEAASAPVTLNEEQIREGASTLLSGRSKLAYQDLVLSIETPDSEGTEIALANAHERISALLEECGVEDVAAARELHEKRTSAIAAAERLQNDLYEAAPDGMAAMETALDALPAQSGDDGDNLEPPDVTELSAARNDAEADWLQAKGELDVAEQSLSDKRAEIRQLEDQVRQLTEQIDPIKQALGPEEERVEKEERLTRTHQDRVGKAVAAKDAYDAAKEDQPSVEQAIARVERLEQTARNRSQDRTRFSEERGKLIGQLNQAGQNGAEEKLADVQAELERAGSRETAYVREGRALSLLVESLEAAVSKRRQQYFEPVKNVVDPLISKVLGSASVSFDDNLGPATIERNGIDEKLKQLSGGTREQIAILTRLGFAKVMAAQGVHVPVVLDDALVYSDDERIEKMFDVINLVASDIQIIAFSCRQKTFEQLGGTHIHKTKYIEALEGA